MTRPPPLLVISHFPPPVHGFAVISDALAESLGQGRTVVRISLSRPARHPALKHLCQALRALGISARLAVWRMRGAREVSLGVNGGLGLLYTILIAGVARLLGFRTVLHHHSYSYITRRSRLMALLCRIGGPRLEHVMLAHLMAEAFERRYVTGGKLHVIQNALFVPQVAPRDRPDGPIRIGLLSNLSREKGLHDFIEVAGRLRGRGVDASFILAGPVASEADRAAIESAVADGALAWRGPLYGAQKQGFFDEIDLFLFPTRYRDEAQPTVIYEAMATGVATLAFARGAISEQVGDCLATLPMGEAFSDWAVTQIMHLDTAEFAPLADRARARHARHAGQAARVLEEVYGTANTAEGPQE